MRYLYIPLRYHKSDEGRDHGWTTLRPKFRSQQATIVGYGRALHSPDALPGGLELSGVRTLLCMYILSTRPIVRSG